MDEEFQKPEAWHVLLLDGTFSRKQNSVTRVASVLAVTLGLAAAVATGKAEQARDNFFSVVHSSEDFKQAVGKAQSLQKMNLLVRVVPGNSLDGSGSSSSNAKDEQSVGVGASQSR